MLGLIKCLSPEFGVPNEIGHALRFPTRRIHSFYTNANGPNTLNLHRMHRQRPKWNDPKLIARTFEHVVCASPVDWYTQYVMPVKMAPKIQSIKTLDGKQLDAASVWPFHFWMRKGQILLETAFQSFNCLAAAWYGTWKSFSRVVLVFFFSISSVRVCRSVLQSEEIKHVYKWNAAHELYI